MPSCSRPERRPSEREQGAAAAEMTRAMSQALANAGPDAREMFVLSQLDTLVAQVARKVQGHHDGEVQVIDSGDGRALPALAASFPQSSRPSSALSRS